ncbi:nucleotide sugar dehydrogenase [Phocaeicola plebeius]
MKENVKIGVIGLGYVGLPLACLFARQFDVVGFDCYSERVKKLLSAEDDTCEVDSSTLRALLGGHLHLTDDAHDMQECNVYIVCVPTPVDEDNNPDLSPLKSASRTIGGMLKKGDVVIYESSVYPGCTEHDCVPVLVAESGLKYNQDFFAGYSPERINPADKQHTVENITKIVSGSTPETADFVEWLYGSVLKNGTCKASSIRVAEAAKVVENTQRDVNIALMNELCTIFRSMGISTTEVLKCAATKWNFVNVRPGLVGGHCIGVDPYYLIHGAWAHKVYPRLIMESRTINERMGQFISEELVKCMMGRRIHVVDSHILILGMAFKANCPDTRNTKVEDVYEFLTALTDHVSIYDPLVSAEEVKRHYGIDLLDDLEVCKGKFDAVILCVAHREFIEKDWRSLLKPEGVLFDAMNVLPDADYYL